MVPIIYSSPHYEEMHISRYPNTMTMIVVSTAIFLPPLIASTSCIRSYTYRGDYLVVAIYLMNDVHVTHFTT